MQAKRFTFAFAILILCAIAVPALKADDDNQATKLTFSQAVAIPGATLPAGTYWFVLAGDEDRDMVRIFNANRTKLLATLQTVTVERAEGAARSVVSFADRGPSEPKALMSWFYPGESTGHQFLYSGAEKKEIAHAAEETITAHAPTSATAAGD